MTRRRIALLLPDMRGGGAERITLDLAHEFANLGYEVEFVLMSATGDFLPEVSRDFQIFDLAVRQFRKVPVPLAHYLRTRHPDALIANMWPLTTVAVIGRELSRCSCTLLLVEHCTLSKQYAQWGRLHRIALCMSMIMSYRLFVKIAAVSEGSASDLAQLAWLPKSQVKVLHNPIPQRAWPSTRALAEAERLWACQKGQRILTVGSLKDQKNHPLLLKAFALLPQQDARLMFLGQGENEALLRTLASELDIDDRVIFAGFHADPSPFYASADLFVLSSDYEGFGNVIVEALSFGLPVVSTDCPSGPSEILENGRWGRLVPVGDADGLARAMDRSLNAPVDHAALKQRAADFAPEIAARKYLDLLGL